MFLELVSYNKLDCLMSVFMYPEDIDITRRIHEKYKTIFIRTFLLYMLMLPPQGVMLRC